MNRDRGIIYITLICLLTALLLTWLLRNNRVAANPVSRNEELVGVIEGVEKETAGLEDRISSLRQDLDLAQKNGAGGQDRLQSIRNQVAALQVEAGLVDLEGPGLELVLDDNAAGAQAAKSANPTAFNPENFIIHDKNVLYIVNDLKAGGAEAISINNQRITDTSHIRCVGTVILVNSTRLAPPYDIKAIGNPDLLEAALNNGTDYPYLKFREFPVRLTRGDKIIIPAYKAGYQFNFTTVAPLTERGDG